MEYCLMSSASVSCGLVSSVGESSVASSMASRKVSSMVSTASSYVLWCKHVYSTFECVKMRTVRAAKVRLVNLLGLGEVILELVNEDY